MSLLCASFFLSCIRALAEVTWAQKIQQSILPEWVACADQGLDATLGGRLLSAWRNRVTCWTCDPDGIVDLLAEAETLVVRWWRLETELLQHPQHHNICRAVVLLALAALLRYSIHSPQRPNWEGYHKYWDDSFTKLLDELDRSAIFHSHRSQHHRRDLDIAFFSAFGMTVSQLRYVQWSSRFKLVGSRWYPNVRNVSFALGLASRCRKQMLRAPTFLAAGAARFEIFDFGTAHGWDSLFFAAGVGCKVLSADGDPQNVRFMRKAFDALITTKQITVETAAVVENTSVGNLTLFCTSRENPEWSQPFSEAKAQGDRCASVTKVPTFSCAELLQRFGPPVVYWKIDVESATLPCLRSLAAVMQHPVPAESKSRGYILAMPRFMSVESPMKHELLNEVLQLLMNVGYTRFKIVAQQSYCLAPERQALGCGSGLFGDEAVDVISGPLWRSSREVKQTVHECLRAESEHIAGRGDFKAWNCSWASVTEFLVPVVRRSTGIDRQLRNIWWSPCGYLRACAEGRGHFDLHAASDGGLT